MKKVILLLSAMIVSISTASAVTVSCTVTSGTVLTSTGGGLFYSIPNGIGFNNSPGTGIISCPAISTGSGFIANYQVLGIVDYNGGPSGTSSGTQVEQILTLVGGSLNGSSVNAIISGGASSFSVIPQTPFQIGSTLGGATSYAGFFVVVNSFVRNGGPVTASTGQVVVSYNVQASNSVPEPSTYALFSTALLGLGYLRLRQRKQ